MIRLDLCQPLLQCSDASFVCLESLDEERGHVPIRDREFGFDVAVDEFRHLNKHILSEHSCMPTGVA